jgi:arsenate reductase
LVKKQIMKKIYHLSSCSTCQKIIAQLNNGEGFDLQDIKTNPITEKQLDFLKEQVGSYEALFSRRAMKYRSMKLNERVLTEKDYRSLILEEYTFLKRPVVIIDDDIFVGNAKKAVQGAIDKLEAQ